MPEKKYSLDSAYQIRAPDDAVRLYGEWAEGYDSEFAESCGYAAPRLIAQAFLRRAKEADQPVLDLGAGTGLVGHHLASGVAGPVDGIDISADMLEVARGKQVYRDLVEADLTRRLDMPEASYGGLISSGTFTHGHVGPDVLPEVLRVAKPGALCVFGIKREVYDEERFGSAFAMLVAAGQITPLDFEVIRIYDRDDHEHAHDVGLTTIFRKAG